MCDLVNVLTKGVCIEKSSEVEPDFMYFVSHVSQVSGAVAGKRINV